VSSKDYQLLNDIEFGWMVKEMTDQSNDDKIFHLWIESCDEDANDFAAITSLITFIFTNPSSSNP